MRPLWLGHPWLLLYFLICSGHNQITERNPLVMVPWLVTGSHLYGKRRQ